MHVETMLHTNAVCQMHDYELSFKCVGLYVNCVTANRSCCPEQWGVSLLNMTLYTELLQGDKQNEMLIRYK